MNQALRTQGLGPLLPYFVGVVVVSFACETLRGFFPGSFWILVLTALVLAYARCAFAYMTWSETGRPEEPRPRRFLALSRTLFGHTLVISIGLGAPLYGLELILIKVLGPLPYLMTQALLGGLVLAITGLFMASAAGRDFLTGLMGMARLAKHSPGLVLLLGLCGPPFSLTALYLLITWHSSASPALGFVLDITRNCLLLYFLWKLVLVRVRMDGRESAPSAGQPDQPSAEAQNDQVH